jgi:hypothetical protein
MSANFDKIVIVSKTYSTVVTHPVHPPHSGCSSGKSSIKTSNLNLSRLGHEFSIRSHHPYPTDSRYVVAPVSLILIPRIEQMWGEGGIAKGSRSITTKANYCKQLIRASGIHMLWRLYFRSNAGDFKPLAKDHAIEQKRIRFCPFGLCIRWRKATLFHTEASHVLSLSVAQLHGLEVAQGRGYAG